MTGDGQERSRPASPLLLATYLASIFTYGCILSSTTSPSLLPSRRRVNFFCQMIPNIHTISHVSIAALSFNIGSDDNNMLRVGSTNESATLILACCCDNKTNTVRRGPRTDRHYNTTIHDLCNSTYHSLCSLKTYLIAYIANHRSYNIYCVE